MTRARWIAIGQTLLVVLLGCLGGVLAKRALNDAVPPFTFVWLQIGIGGVLLTVVTFGVRRAPVPRGLPRRVWVYLVLLGLGNFAAVRVLFMLSLGNLPANTHVFLVNFVTFATMYLSIAMLNERPSRLQVLGSVVGVGGIWLYFAAIPRAETAVGVVYAVAGVVVLACMNNLARLIGRIGREIGLSTGVVSTVSLWIGGVPVVAAGLVVDGWPVIAGEHWAVITYNGVVAIAIGPTVWNHVMRTLRSYEASMLAASSVVFVALFAIPILGETLAPHEIAGVALLMGGIALTQIRAR